MSENFMFSSISNNVKEIETEVLEMLLENNPDIAKDLKAKLDEIEEESRLKVAFVGQHNAGKSTIVSALTNDESIKISSNVETDTTSEYQWNDVLLYDTPGLYAGVKESHDESAKKAIEVSDLVVFCITASLFDDLLIKDFSDLAYVRGYRNKILLVVNKMSLEEGDYDELVNNYKTTLRITLDECGGNLADFPICFIDAKDYRDGIEDEDDELIEFSHFTDLVDLLNQQIQRKGLLGKVETRCHLLLDAISEAIAFTGTEADKNMLTVLNRLNKAVRSNKKDMHFEFLRRLDDLRTRIMGVGSEMVSLIGAEDITKEKCDEYNIRIEELTADAVSNLETALTEVNNTMNEDMQEVFESEVGMFVFNEFNSGKINVESQTAKSYANLLATYGNIEKYLKQGSSKIVNLALKNGAGNFSKLANSSGSVMHQIVLNVGHFFGKTFKPWEAIKIAGRIGKVASYAGPVFSVIDTAITVGEKIMSERNIKMIQDAKIKSFNQFSGIAGEIVDETEKQYALMEKELFDKRIAEINAVKTSLEEEAVENTEYVSELKQYSSKLAELIESINN